MRLAGNSQPEWGYMVPAPSFARTARIVVVAIAIGATAGAAVVLSLVGRSADAEADAGKAPVVVRTALLPAVPASAAAETSGQVAGTTAPTPSSITTPAQRRQRHQRLQDSRSKSTCQIKSTGICGCDTFDSDRPAGFGCQSRSSRSRGYAFGGEVRHRWTSKRCGS